MNLDELGRLAQAATPGPWEASEHQDGDWGVSVTDDQGELYVAVHQARPGARFMADAAFIASCNPETVRALVAVVRAQGAMLRRLEWAVDWSRFGIASNHCPVCGNERSHGHTPNCELAALLAALPGAAGTGGEG
jgi:predicted ArsR family transcriptional regulator